MTTTATNVDLIKSLFEAFGRGDIAFILAHVAPECRWKAPGQGIPNAGEYRGPGGAAEFFTKLAASEDVVGFEPREYFTNGDDVVALGREEFRSKLTGKTAETNWAMLFRVRGGKVTEWEAHYDTEAWARAHAG